MSKELALVAQILATGRDVEQLEAIKDRLPEIPTPELVTGFAMANTYSKRIGTFVDAVKKELVDNKQQSGRFLDYGEEDAKGHRYLEGVDGRELKAEKRVRSVMDAEKAHDVLEEKGLLEAALVTKRRCSDAEGVYQLAQAIADGKMTKAVMQEKAEEILKRIEAETVVDEGKVEALVTLGDLNIDDVQALMNTTITYAVKEVKKK